MKLKRGRVLLKKKWRYSDGERPQGKCYDCGLPYTDPGFFDLLIPDEAWEKINPTEHPGAGLLCACCIARRLDAVGLSDVPASIRSGFQAQDSAPPVSRPPSASAIGW